MTSHICGIEAYRSQLDGAEEVPLWQQPWWLDAVAPGRWDARCVLSNERVVAALPYVPSRKLGFDSWGMPQLTQALGPWLEPLDGKYASRLSREHALLNLLADAIPRSVFYVQNWTVDRVNWLPFYWRGYRQTTRYTLRVPAMPSGDAWGGLAAETRNAIRK